MCQGRMLEAPLFLRALKKPMDVVRYLEDELSKVESKLINFPELKLSEADKVSLIFASDLCGC